MISCRVLLAINPATSSLRGFILHFCTKLIPFLGKKEIFIMQRNEFARHIFPFLLPSHHSRYLIWSSSFQFNCVSFPPPPFSFRSTNNISSGYQNTLPTSPRSIRLYRTQFNFATKLMKFVVIKQQ